MHTLILLGIRTKRVGNYSHPHSIGTTPAGWGGGIRDVQEVWTLTLDDCLANYGLKQFCNQINDD